MNSFEREPVIRVGLLTAPIVRFSLIGSYRAEDGTTLVTGEYEARQLSGLVSITGASELKALSLTLTPVDFAVSRVTVQDVTIGIEFHWQRREAQVFQGAISLRAAGEQLRVVNELPLEDYLVSVISSEMSALSPSELLRAHSIVSRSWLLSQMSAPRSLGDSGSLGGTNDGHERVRWYDRQSHDGFDVCADDHCQRYQGISKALSSEAFRAVGDTRGLVLTCGGEICDARYSKSCGGMTEEFRAAWEDKHVPYLVSVYDGRGSSPKGFDLPLEEPENSNRWIRSSPPAFCNASSRELLSRILPGFDQETSDFYRWRVAYSNTELSDLLREKIDVDFGRISRIEPVQRGKSGRIVMLRIRGERRTLVIGKELEIRRAFSRSHLYSSAFVIDVEDHPGSEYPKAFVLWGAGWGHGVGLCQIGAAVMAEEGYGYEDILSHYFRGASVTVIY